MMICLINAFKIAVEEANLRSKRVFQHVNEELSLGVFNAFFVFILFSTWGSFPYSARGQFFWLPVMICLIGASVRAV